MESAERFSAEHRELLLELALLLSEQRGVDEVFAAFSSHIRGGPTFDFTSLFVTTSDPTLVRDAGHYPEGGDFTQRGTLHKASDMGADHPGIVGGTEYIPRKLDLSSTRALAEAGYERAWVTALQADGENFGMLTVAKLARGAFPPDHIAFLQAAAALLARAVRQDLELERARLTAARAEAARELIFALQAHEPFDSIFKKLPALLEGCLSVDYVGLLVDEGEGFVIGAEAPAGVHRGLAGTAEGTSTIRGLAEHGDFVQSHTGEGASASLAEAGYKRVGLTFLREADEVRGVLMLARYRSRGFDHEEQHFIALLKAILSQSLANQRRLQRSETGAARARILNEVALLANAGEDIETIFERLGGLLHRAVELDYVSLLKVEDDSDDLVVVGSRPATSREPGTRVPRETATIEPIDTLQGPVAQYDLREWAQRSELAGLAEARGLRRAAVVPIRQGGELLGTLSFARTRHAPFDPEEEGFLATLSAVLGQAINNRRRLVAAEAEAARSGLLNELAVLLNNGESPAAFFHSVSTRLKTVVPFDGLALLVAEPGQSSFRVVESARRQAFYPGFRLRKKDLGEYIAARLDAGDVVIAGTPSEAGRDVGDFGTRAGVQRGAVAAIRHAGELMGLFVMARDTDIPFTRDEQAFLELVCVLVGQAIANRRKVEEKETEAIQSQALSEIALVLQGGRHIRDHFQDLSNILLQAVGFDFVSVTTRDLVTGQYAALRTHELLLDNTPVPFRPVTIELIMEQEGRVAMQYATENSRQPVPRALRAGGFQRAVSAIIISPDGPQGLLTIGRRERTRFTPEEMRFIELLAALLGQTTSNYAKAYARAAEALRSRILSELALLLNNGEPIDTHFQRLRELLVEGVGFDYCSIIVRRPGSESFRTFRSEEVYGSPEAAPPFDATIIDRVLGQGGFSVQYGSEITEDGIAGGVFEFGIQRGASFILTTGSRAQGILTIGRRRPEVFAADEMAFFEVVASLLANVAENEERLWLSNAQAEDQAIVAEAAAAVARETEPVLIARSLRDAVGRFLPQPFVRFAYAEGDSVVFHGREGQRVTQEMGHFLLLAAEHGQSVARPVATRVAAGEPTLYSKEFGLDSAIFTRAESAGALVGFLILGSREEGFEAGPRECEIARQIAGIAGPAMANARAAERERAEAEEQAIIAAAAAAVAGEIEPLAIVRSLRSAVDSFVPRPFVNFGYVEGGLALFPSREGPPRPVRLGPLFHDALREGQAIVPNAAGRPEEFTVEPDRVGLQAHVATRATSGGAIVGLLVVGSRDPAFSPGERELRLCRLLADMVGPAMANSRAVARERREAEDQAIIAEAAAAVARETSPLGIVRGLRAAAGRFIPAPFVNFGYIEAGGVRFPSTSGLLEVLGIDAYFTRAIADGQVIVPATSGRIAAGERLDGMAAIGLESHTVTAALSAGALAGLLVIGSREPAFVPGERELRLSRLIADIVGPAMANARAIERERIEADDQRILAQTAAAVAASATETALTEALQEPVRELVPEGRVLFFYIEGDSAHTPGWPDALALEPAVLELANAGPVVVDVEEAGLPESILREARARNWRRWVYTMSQSGGDTLGMLVVTTSDPSHHFSERELRLFNLIANFAGPAMANLRESARRQRDAEEQRIIAEAATALAAGATELDLLNGLVIPIRRLVPRARVAFRYIEGDDLMLWDGRNRHPLSERNRNALRTGQEAGSVTDEGITPGSREMLEAGGIREYCDSAAISAGSPIGLLFVGTPVEGFRFSEAALRMLRMIADIAGPAMANARADRRRAEEAEDERVISEVAALATRSGPLELLKALPGALAPLIPGTTTLYGFFDGETVRYQLFEPEQKERFGGDEFALPLTDVGRNARENGQATGSLAAIPPERPYASLGLHDYSITTYTSGGALGALMVASNDPGFHFDDRALALLRRIVQVVGPTVEASRAEAERARQAALYSLILRSLSEGVILADFEGRVVFANDLGRAILRALDPTGAGTTWQGIVELLPESLRDGYRAVYERGEGSRGRTAFDVDGKTAWFDYEIVPLNDPVMRALVVAADVTADVEREGEQERHREQMAQAQRLAALGELIGGVAHELNNPLTAIVGFAEVMALSPAAGPLGEELEIIQKEALRARNIVRDLLFIVRPGTAERSVIDVAGIVGHIERIRRADWTQAGIAWTSDIAPGCSVWGNEHQLTQVVLNLITNAEQALAGQPERSIRVSAREEGVRTFITVSDSGAGMDEATRSRVFEPFFTTKQGVGTGLGLALSYSIVQSHGGEIRIDSTPGGGSTFTLSLPALARAGAPALPELAGGTNGKTRILVIDDEPSLRKVCQRLIASMGHECATAESAAVAIELAGTADFDVVLCDYRLATETADKVIAGFEQVAPQLIARTVIATGATTDPGVLDLTERYSLRLMAKPYGMEELASIIQPAGVGGH